ncbi:MAG: Hsp20/alpha crystallin family protein [Candidatus Hydrogenedentes bacterium]|nr:Hsp20/alpha crystallin family protein [Candidatus Hydrogenedentota bacterium]
MALVRWKNRNEVAPWSALRDLEADFNRMFGNVFGEVAPSERKWAPAADLKETADAYTIEADLPGVKKEDIELTVLDDTITIKGERKTEKEGKDAGYHCVERRYGGFQRRFRIPGGFDAAKVKADYEHGVLRVTLPKREESKPKQIEVKVN